MFISRGGIPSNSPGVRTVDNLAALPAVGSEGEVYLVLDLHQLRTWNVGSGTWVEPTSGAIPSAHAWTEDEYSPSKGQTEFILSYPPLDDDTVTFYVRGVQYDDDLDWSISGQTVTWLEHTFPLDVGDKVLIRYQR